MIPLDEYRQRIEDGIETMIRRRSPQQAAALGDFAAAVETVARGPGAAPAGSLGLMVAEGLGIEAAAALPLASALELLRRSGAVLDLVARAESAAEPAAGPLGRWGPPLSLNVADGFFNLAQAAFLQVAGQAPSERARGLAARFDDACMALSEALRLRLEGEEKAPESAADAARSEGALTAAAARLASVLAGRPDRDEEALAAFGAWSGAAAAAGSAAEAGQAIALAVATLDAAALPVPARERLAEAAARAGKGGEK